MPKGNPNPSPKTRFKPGVGPNPGGKTSEQKRIEMRNAEMAMAIRERVLHAALAKLNELSTDEVLESYVDAAMLKLLKDSEDRGLGQPVQPTDHTSSDGSMTPRGLDVSKLSDAVLREILAAGGDTEQG